MAVVQKKKKSKRPSYRNGPYPDSVSGQGDPGYSDLHFNPNLKVSKYTNPQWIAKGGNPAFTMPIPKTDVMKAPMFNDEVDMYFPRKHFLARYTMYNDMVDNIVLKQIPLHKITPPKVFPIAFVEGEPFERKKASLIAELKAKDSEPAAEKPVSHVTDTETHKDDDNMKIEDEEKKNEELKSDIKTENDKETKKVDGDEDENKSGSPLNEENMKEKTDLTTSRSASINSEVNDDNLSDYDPDPIEYENPIQYTEKEDELLNNYLSKRLSAKQSTDFFFGDLKAMKLQEKGLETQLENLESDLQNVPNYISSRYKYNISQIDKLHESILSFTATSISEMDKQLTEIESNLKETYKVKFVDSLPVRKFSTSAFDSYKSSISPEDYILKFKQKPKMPDPHQHTLSGESQSLQQDKQQFTDKPTMQESTDVNNDDERKSGSAISQNFDFEGDMLYGNGEMGADGDAGMVDDEDLGYLNNEVFF